MNTAILDLTTDPQYTQYDRALRRISMESELIGNFANTVKSVIPKLMDFAKNKFNNYTFFVPSKANVGEFNSFINALDKYSPASAEELVFYVPEGFKGNLVDYTVYLSNSLKHCSDIVGEVLNPYAIFLSKIISNQDYQKSNLVDLEFINAREKELTALVNKTSDFFSKGGVSAQQRLGNITSRVSDVSTTIVNLMEMRKDIEALDNKSVQANVSKVSVLIDQIIKDSNKGKLDSISGEVLKSLGESTLIVARDVEFYAITMFRVNVFYNQMVKTAKHLTN